MITEKECKVCKEVKPIGCFRVYVGRSKDGYRPLCSECQNAYDRAYRARKKAEREAAKA